MCLVAIHVCVGKFDLCVFYAYFNGGRSGNVAHIINCGIAEAVTAFFARIRGVYEAVASAMARKSGSESAPIEVKVFLDGKQITAAVEKNQKERGVAFMGTQVYAY